jgi:hypothetical protein
MDRPDDPVYAKDESDSQQEFHDGCDHDQLNFVKTIGEAQHIGLCPIDELVVDEIRCRR